MEAPHTLIIGSACIRQGAFTGRLQYWRHIPNEKHQIVEETLSSGRSVAKIARSHEVNANQVFDWCKQYLEERLGADVRECAR
ncbi:transposase [Paraburkholderia sediminicola]|uniref:transposase n=1 Tax=Paraburkholderia sediminicola TaxID=458836 RepID=UPI0038B7A25B